MASLSEILKSLVARNDEEATLLQSILRVAQSFLTSGQRDMGLALAASSPSERESETALPQLLTALPEESRTHFSGLVEALEIYQSIHGPVASILSLNETAVTELRKIRELCLDGGTHAYY
jgi:hypothetical protein